MNGDILCPKCGKRVPKLSLYGHLSVIHGLSHPEIGEVSALEEDDSEHRLMEQGEARTRLYVDRLKLLGRLHWIPEV